METANVNAISLPRHSCAPYPKWMYAFEGRSSLNISASGMLVGSRQDGPWMGLVGFSG